jgi:uncharacterized protein (TIRG00374 family)
MKDKTRKAFRWIYILATIGIIAVIGVTDSQMKSINLLDIVSKLSLVWVLLALSCILLYWLTDSIIINYVTGFMFGKEPLYKSLKISIIGQYYSALTPSSTGGQPFQVIYMKRNGVPVGASTCILSIKFLCYQLALCTFYIVGMLIRGEYFIANFNRVFWISLAGFAVNASAIVFILLILVNRNLVLRFSKAVIRFLHRLHIVKNLSKANDSAETMIEDFTTALGYVKKYIGKVFITYLISLAHLTCFFSVSLLIYTAFGLTQYGFADLLLMQSFLFIAISFFPLPGAAGAAEGGFLLFFNAIFPPQLIFIAMILWRIITYYANIIAGAAVVVSDEFIRMSKKKPGKEA